MVQEKKLRYFDVHGRIQALNLEVERLKKELAGLSIYIHDDVIEKLGSELYRCSTVVEHRIGVLELAKHNENA